MIRVVLADDEVLARQKLRQLLREEQDIEIVGECATATETIQLVGETSPEILFLDIRMPDMDGFDVIGALSVQENSSLPQIIFTTAYDRYALRAFDINAADYLLKPFTLGRLRSAVQRVRERSLVANLGEDERGAGSIGNRFASRIVFKSRGRILFLPVNDIQWIGAEENYVRIRTGIEAHLLRETMARLETRLDPQVFLRVHRSAIVNLQYVKEVKTEAEGDSTVVLLSGETVKMSRSYRLRLHKQLRR